jgi:hypothetical protein
MTDRPLPAWAYAIAGSLAAVIGLVAVLWFGQRGDGAPEAGSRTSAAAPAGGAAAVTDSLPGALAPAAQGLPAPEASPTPSPAQVHEMFAAAVQKAREAPAVAPPPGIAKAKSLEEAFPAMQAAQPAPPNPGAAAAAQNPFGAVR